MSPLAPAGDGLDTALARLLDASGVVSREVLRRTLDEVRAQRASRTDLSLGTLLLERGAVSAQDLDQALAQLAPPSAPSERGPQQIGPYRVLRVLGQGGMGKVYAVEHVETGRHEALKTLDHALDPDELERFRREAEAMAALQHPNLVRIHGGQFETARPYLCVELCSGGSLEDKIAKGRLSPAEVLALAAPLAEALDALHARGILHRDLKPANVLFDEEGRPKLADFGLAAVAGASGLTATGEILGTPAYMAPEQAGRAHQADARADVYGLAATLYAALTGGAPFVGAGLFGVLAKVLEEPPTPPSKLGIELPPELEAGILAGLAKRPDQRPATPGAFVASLRGEWSRPRPERSGVPAGLLAALLIGLLAAGLTLGWALTRDSEPQVSESPTPSQAPASSSPAVLPSSSVGLWRALAEGEGPEQAETWAKAWQAAVTEPPTRAQENRIARRGPEGAELVAYLRLSRGDPPGRECVRLLRWTQFDGEVSALYERYLSEEALSHPYRHQQKSQDIFSQTQAALKRIEALVSGERTKLAPPLRDYFVGRFQAFYCHIRNLLKILAADGDFKATGEQDLGRVLSLGDGLASVEARVAFYGFRLNKDIPEASCEGLAGADLQLKRTFESFVGGLYLIQHGPDLEDARRRANLIDDKARKLGVTTKGFSPKALLTFSRRLLRDAVREGRGDYVREAEEVLARVKSMGVPDHICRLHLYSCARALQERDLEAARQALLEYDAVRKQHAGDHIRIYDQSRQLHEAMIALLQGDPQRTLDLIAARPKGDSFKFIETEALEAHAYALLGQEDDSKKFLESFELKLRTPPLERQLGWEWYLRDTRGVIAGTAWWPGKGPLPEPR